MGNKRELGEPGAGVPSVAAGTARGLTPGSRIAARVRVPGSKSLGIRSLLCAGLAEGSTEIAGLPPSEDVEAALRVLRQSGVDVQELGTGHVRVRGRSPATGGAWRTAGPLECGESGTLARLVTGIAAWCGDASVPCLVSASGSLLQRESSALFDCLKQSGVTCEFEGEGFRGREDGWPVRLTAAPPGETVMLQGPSSSQELSALLIAMAAHAAGPRGRSVLVMGGLPSEPYAHMTLQTLRAFGAEVSASGAEWRVAGPLSAPKEIQVIEADASAAAVALAAGCLAGSEVRVAGFGAQSSQGDLVILKYLQAFGCEAEQVGEELVASGDPQNLADLDFEDCPDLAPILVALAGAVILRQGVGAGSCRFRGLETLNGKECRRLEVLASALRSLGIAALETEDSLALGPGAAQAPETVVLDPHGDHRMAFAFALLGLVCPGVLISNPDCVAKSWPSFWRDLTAR